MLRRTWLPALLVSLILGSGALAAAEAQPGPGNRTVAAAAGPALTPAQFEQRLLSRTNARRASAGCPALRSHPALVRAARTHTRLMVRAGQLTHQLAGEASFDVRITRQGYRNWKALAENIVVGPATPASLFSSWLASPRHRRNIENCRFRDIGLGVTYGGGSAWATMDLGRR